MGGGIIKIFGGCGGTFGEKIKNLIQLPKKHE